MAVDPLPVIRRTDLSSLSEAVARIAAGLNLGAVAINHNLGNVKANYVLYPFRKYSTTANNLPSANAAGVGAVAMVTDSIVSLAAGIGTVVVGGDGNIVPVFSDGTNWIIG